MDYQEAIKIVNKKRIKNSKLKAGHVYKHKHREVSFRVLGFSLDIDTLDVMVIYSKVDDTTFYSLFNAPIDAFVDIVEI